MSSKVRDSFQAYFTAPATAIAFSLVCGFKPKHVVVTNLTSLSKLEWWEGMSAANAMLTTASSGAVTKVTSAGITCPDSIVYHVNTDGAQNPVTGTITTVGSVSSNAGSGRGFTVGLDTTVNIKDEVLSIFAE